MITVSLFESFLHEGIVVLLLFKNHNKMTALKRILDEKIKLQNELESVSDKLHKLREKIDKLLQEKVSLDEESASLSNEIQNCR